MMPPVSVSLNALRSMSFFSLTNRAPRVRRTLSAMSIVPMANGEIDFCRLIVVDVDENVPDGHAECSKVEEVVTGVQQIRIVVVDAGNVAECRVFRRGDSQLGAELLEVLHCMAGPVRRG